ncbi:hypothetical protein V2J09_019461 [Rumex salicifolius]
MVLRVYHHAFCVQVVLAAQVICWTFQFLGHGVFEKRAPALLDNLSQAFLMAPFFVLLEALELFFGYEPSPGFRTRVKAKVEANIKEWQESKQKKISHFLYTSAADDYEANSKTYDHQETTNMSCSTVLSCPLYFILSKLGKPKSDMQVKTTSTKLQFKSETGYPFKSLHYTKDHKQVSFDHKDEESRDNYNGIFFSTNWLHYQQKD